MQPRQLNKLSDPYVRVYITLSLFFNSHKNKKMNTKIENTLKTLSISLGHEEYCFYLIIDENGKMNVSINDDVIYTKQFNTCDYFEFTQKKIKNMFNYDITIYHNSAIEMYIIYEYSYENLEIEFTYGDFQFYIWIHEGGYECKRL